MAQAGQSNQTQQEVRVRIIKRGTCEACPAYGHLHGSIPVCHLGRETEHVRTPTDLTATGLRLTIAPKGKCKRPKSHNDFMETLRNEKDKS